MAMPKEIGFMGKNPDLDRMKSIIEELPHSEALMVWYHGDGSLNYWKFEPKDIQSLVNCLCGEHIKEDE